MICLTSLLDFPRGCACKPKRPDRLVLASPLPPRLFKSPGYPPVLAAIKATVVEVHHSEGLLMGQQVRHSFGLVLQSID